METIERLFKDTELENPRRFFPEQLQVFTLNFSKSLGSGASGDVYKGILHNGVQVAVKVLKGGMFYDGIKDQFKAEVSILGNPHHRNLVKLYGFCFEHNMKALVYEFMENESLDKVLYGNQSIKWETLCNIAIGIAKGLSYLHEDCQPRIIHYDVKPANILLDSEFSPKVGDFGLAKQLSQDKTHITESRVRGTFNYIAPELLLSPYSPATAKCDVYSFGITLFDIVGRRRHVLGEGEQWFPRQVWKKFEEGRQEEIMDDCGIQGKDRQQAKRILMIALCCVQFLPCDRPSMSHIFRLLEGSEEVKMPPNPFLYMGVSNAVLEVIKPLEEKPMENDVGNISHITLGPWGGTRGSYWDDGIFAGIKKIQVFQGIDRGVAIWSMQIWYCGEDGESIWTERHGYKCTESVDTIELDYPSEYLTSVTGFYDYAMGNNEYVLVRSLSFFTNKKKFGPFGDESGTYFTSQKGGKVGKIVGFHGRDGYCLDAIGVHIEYS